MDGIPAETFGEEIVNKTHHKYWSPFVDYLCILDLLFLLYISLLAFFPPLLFSPWKQWKNCTFTFGFHSFESPVKVREHYIFPSKRREDLTQSTIIYIPVCTYIYIYIYIYINTHMYICVCVCMYVYRPIHSVLKKVQSNLYHMFRRMKENISIWD